MAYSNIVFQFSQIAKSLKELAHTEEHHAFSRVGSLRDMDEFLSQLNFITGAQLVFVDSDSGRLDDSSKSDNLMDKSFYTFCVLKKVSSGDYDESQSVKADCRLIVKKILSKLFYFKRHRSNGFGDLERSSIYYDAVGPIAQGYYGTMVSFNINAPAGIIFNNDDWI